MMLSDLAWVKKGKRRMKFLVAFNRVLTQAEMKSKLGLAENDDVNLGEWVKRGLIICKTPKITKGRIYDLTQRGLRARKRLLESFSEEEGKGVLKDTHNTFSYFQLPRGINLKKYAKIIASRKLRVRILAVLGPEWIRVVDEYVGKREEKIHEPGIKSLLKRRGMEVSRSNLIDGLKEMVRIGVVGVKREESRRNYYRLSEDGSIIKKWLLRIELINDGWV
jgi:DNA-binding PadR family transcriptional regulator